MRLSQSQAREILRNPKHKREIESAKRHESALRVFTEEMDSDELSSESYWNNLTNTIKSRLDKKFGRVFQFVRYPLPTVQITDSILNDFFKVFEGKNRYFGESSNNDIEVLTAWIRQNNPQEWVELQAREVFKNKPCSFVVVDRDNVGIPYLLMIDTSRLIDAKFIDGSKEGELDYIAFVHSVEATESDEIVTSYSVYDEENYYVFSKSNKSDSYNLVSETSHGLGFCPARAFVSENSNTKNPFKRKSVFSQSISKLEDWTIFDIYRNYTDHYAPFPITESPKSRCANPKCKDGVVIDEEIIDRSTGEKSQKITKCQVCSNESDLIGPGTHIRIKLQSNKDAEDGSGKFKMHFPETDKMQYIPDKLDDLELEIRYKSVGYSTILTKESVNELQVKGSFTSMESVLLRNKAILDSIYKWSVSTVAKLIYPNFPISIEGNYGTEFYLVSEDELQLRFDNAKKNNMPIEEQLSIYKQLIETKYKGNPSKMKKHLTLLDIDFFPIHSLEECIVLKNESVIDDYQLSLKANFLTYVNRFETENADISEFGNSLPYWEKIKIIKTTFEAYNAEFLESKNLRANPVKGENDAEPVVTQEQLDAQANLRGSVGGVQGLLGIQESVVRGITSSDSAIATMIEIYGFSEATARKILGINL